MAGPHRIRFTQPRVAAFSCPADRPDAFLWDTDAPGLGLRAWRGGARRYVFQARLQGRTVRITLGSPQAWALDDARAQARRLKVLVDSGTDPRHERAERVAEAEARRHEAARRTVTLDEAWQTYIAARRHEWTPRYLRDHLRVMQAPGQTRKRSDKLTVAGPLWALRGARLAEITPDALTAWLEHEKKTRPTSTAQAYRLLRAFLGWCAEQPAYRVDPAALLTGSVRRAVPKPRAKDDCLQREQLRLWFAAVRAIPNPVIAAYLQGLMLTGARREELAGLRWVDVDFQWRSITVRDKAEGERVIPLTPYLAQLFHALPRRNAWVFSSPQAKSGRLTDARGAHVRALHVAGLPHLTLHGLRRSFGTLSEWVEAPVGVVAQIMGHKPSALAEKHYRRRPLDLLRQWHTRIEAWVLNEAGIAQPAEAIGLRAVG